jgi:DNA polymerase I-like protein with 3'-5' exonuclease and polymerase domains
MSKIKQHFVSRWEGGYILEADFSQLEVIALAHLTQDKQLIADIMSGIDLHCVRAAELFDVPQSRFIQEYKAGDKTREKQRKLAKAFSFQLQYGSGPTNMAKTNGVPVSVAKKFIENYYNRYPRIKEWQDEIAKEIQITRKPSKHLKTKKGIPAGQGYHKSETCRRYVFQEFDNDYRPGQVRFSSTQMKNYPVQGFATADIVPLVLGELLARLKDDPTLAESCLMINTIHDSIIFDVRSRDILDYAAHTIQDTMQSAPALLKQYFGIDFTLPLHVDVEYGKNWMELEKYT